ncbi:MAG: carboxypeptidase-like regulatory domain-containing protein, partial [Calditrichota bacterium]
MLQPSFTPLLRAGFLWPFWSISVDNKPLCQAVVRLTWWTWRTINGRYFCFLILLFIIPFNLAQAAVGVSVQGWVTNSLGQPLPGAQVRVMELQVGAAAAWDGRYELANIPTGAWTLEASHLSFRSSLRKIYILEGSPQKLDFSLLPQPIVAPEAV